MNKKHNNITFIYLNLSHHGTINSSDPPLKDRHTAYKLNKSGGICVLISLTDQ